MAKSSARRRPPSPRPRAAAASWAASLAGVFALGVALGALGGLAFGLFERDGGSPEGKAAVSDAPAPSAEGEAAYRLPVTVRQSERARDAYLDAYEENLAAAPPPPALPKPSSPQPSLTQPEPPATAPLSADQPTSAAGVGRDQEPSAPASEDGPAESLDAGPAADAPALSASDPAPARTWLARAQPASLDPARPILAVVIDDAGVDVVRSRRAVRLPGPLTLAFLPYGYDLRAMVQTARENGHEIMVHLPMEPTSPDADPGPEALLTGLSGEELERRIAWNFGRFDHYVGVNNHMGSKFSSDPDGMRRVLRRVAAEGLFFLDSVTTTETQGYRLAQEMGVPFAVRDVFIDHSLQVEAIRGQLAEAVEIAKRQGYAVAIAHPHDETLAALADWLPRIEAETGVQLVPLSAVIRRRYGEG
ncbi:MAG: divergent polysaccharide deacetylase family protein [Marivibrio sp.]|uniref:divergent polysaccharide deacetylase family protein n=1 Tax=Marivibrio sp. TaxID=2039719 RepID=UPI0032EFE6A3